MDHGTMTGWDLIPVPEPAEASAHGDGPASLGAPQATATTSGSSVIAAAASARRAAERAASVKRVRALVLAAPADVRLLAVLAVQTVPLVQLVRADTAFQDGAPYFRAGRLSMATRQAGPTVRVLLRQAAGHLPAAWRTGGQRRWAGRGPGSCPGSSCSEQVSCCGPPLIDCAVGPPSLPPRCLPSCAQRCTWGVCHRRRHVGVPVALVTSCVVRAGERQDVLARITRHGRYTNDCWG